MNDIGKMALFSYLPHDVRAQMLMEAEAEERLIDIARLTGAGTDAILNYLTDKPYGLWDLWFEVRAGRRPYQDLVDAAKAMAAGNTD